MKNFLYFLAGTAVGAGVTYFVCNSIFKEKLSKQANDIYNYYKEKYPDENEVKEETEEVKYTDLVPKAPVKPDITTVIKQYNTTSIQDKPVTNNSHKFGPYVVAGIFAGKDGYELWPETWNYYANDVLTDASGRPLTIDEIEHYVGADFADHLGEVDNTNTTYFRNEELGIDIEIYDNGDEEYNEPTAGIVRDDD